MSKPEPILLIPDAMGVYIPRNFATYFGDKRSEHVSNIEEGTWHILEQGPEHPLYWEEWEEVCHDAVVKDAKGFSYLIHHDGDCWLIPIGMEWNDEANWFVWP